MFPMRCCRLVLLHGSGAQGLVLDTITEYLQHLRERNSGQTRRDARKVASHFHTRKRDRLCMQVSTLARLRVYLADRIDDQTDLPVAKDRRKGSPELLSGVQCKSGVILKQDLQYLR